MNNNQSGFAFLPAILIIGLLIVGGGAGALITKKVYETPGVPSQNTSESEDIVLSETENTMAIAVEEEIPAEPDLTETILQEQTETASVIHSITSEPTPDKEQVNTDSAKMVITPVASEVKETLIRPIYLETQVSAYDQIKADSDKLDEKMSEAKMILTEAQSEYKEALTACRMTYEAEVASIESRWKSDFSYYKRQIEDEKSQSPLYEGYVSSNLS